MNIFKYADWDLCSGRTSTGHRSPRRPTACGDDKRHRASGLHHCRNCSTRPGTSPSLLPVALLGYQAAAGQCLRSRTNRFAGDRWSGPISGVLQSRTIHLRLWAAGLVVHNRGSRTVVRWSKCTLPVRQI